MQARSSKLLLDEYPLILLPSLACVFGDRPAIFLQQIHYWCKIFERQGTLRHYHAGRWWVWNTIDGWHEQFAFWSPRTIERIISRCTAEQIILIGNYNRRAYDRTRWYTPNYSSITEKIDQWERKQATNQPPPSCQNGMMEQANLTGCIMPEWHDGTCQNDMMDHATLACTIPETTQRLDTEISTDMAITWRTCTEELALQLPRATHSAWIAHAQLTAYDPGSHTAVIVCATATVQQHLSTQLHPRILATLAAILHQPSLSIEYTEGKAS